MIDTNPLRSEFERTHYIASHSAPAVPLTVAWTPEAGEPMCAASGEPYDDGLGCARGLVNALAIMLWLIAAAFVWLL